MSKGGGQSPTGDFLMRPNVLPWNWQHAQNIANNPFQEYPGTMSAGVNTALSSGGNAALDVARYQPQMISPWQMGAVPNVTAAQMGNVPNMQAAQMGSVPNVQSMTGMSGINTYMNPYTESVVNATQADIERQRQMATNQNASGAAMSNAWGGDRHGVENALTNEAAMRTSANATANLRMGGFNTAAGLAMTDADRAMQAALANQGMAYNTGATNAGFQQQAGLANQGAGLQTAQQNALLGQQANLANQNIGFQTGQQNALLGQQANLANQSAGLQGATTNLAGAQTLGQLGMNQYNIEQSGLDRAYQEFLRQMNQPYLNQQMLNTSLGAFGVMGGQWTPPSYPMTDVLSGASQGAGYYLMGL